jgi:energy-converting hydrogenase Eha subunit F
MRFAALVPLVFLSALVPVTVPGFSMTQVPLPEANLGYITVTFEPLDDTNSNQWTAFASSVDNHSGDSWLQNAVVR